MAIRADALAGSEPALRRLALRALAERASGRPVPLSRRRAAQIMRLATLAEGGDVELGGGVRAICEAGLIRFVAGSMNASRVWRPTCTGTEVSGEMK